ncbi:MAG: helicase-associated domain-containing protein [Polyangiales bacterium]
MQTRAAIVQGDRSVLVEVDHPAYDDARQVLAKIAELEKSPEHVHTYRLSDLALWNAASRGWKADAILDSLRGVSRFDLPSVVEHEVRDRMSRHGVCVLHDYARDPMCLRLSVNDRFVRERLAGDPKAGPILRPCPDGFLVEVRHRGLVKQTLLQIGYPVEDRAGLVEGEPLAIALRHDVFSPYEYQRRAVEAFVESGAHGVIVLPCGAGKTVVAMMSAAALGVRTLILTSGREAAAQWRRELLSKTDLSEETVVVFEGRHKRIAP